MNLPWRIALYVALVACAVFCSQRFLAIYRVEADRVSRRFDIAESAPTENPAPVAAGASDTNATVAPAGVTNAPGAERTAPNVGRGQPAAAPGGKGLFGALALVSLIALGLMAGREVAQYLGHRVQREIYGEASGPIGDPEYDEAERVWANGEHLEAIRLLREFLQRKPQKLHAAFRIAEIYEKDLQNNLAAALEYEEILKQRFDPERWGWAAIHLVNLYNRLGQSDKAGALLERLVNEQGHTAAAAKARERLGLPEGEPVEAPVEAVAAPADDTAAFKLPPGFKRK